MSATIEAMIKKMLAFKSKKEQKINLRIVLKKYYH